MKTYVFSLVILLLQVREGNGSDNEPVPRNSVGLVLGADIHYNAPVFREKPDDFFHRVAQKGNVMLEERLYNAANPFRISVHELTYPDRNVSVVSMSYVASSFKYALREVVVDTGLVQNSREWLKDFFEGMIGNTEEEQVNLVETPHLQYSDESWREKVRGHKIKWGVRPFRWPDPYVYVSGQIGNHDKKEIFLWHLRYYVKKFEVTDLERQRVEALISLRLPESFFLSTGFVFRFKDHDQKNDRSYLAAFRIEKWWQPDRRGAFFVGADVYRNLTVVTGGFLSF